MFHSLTNVTQHCGSDSRLIAWVGQATTRQDAESLVEDEAGFHKGVDGA